MDNPSLTGALLELRESFDHAFVQARAPLGETDEGLLAIRIRGEPYVLRLADVDGLFADRRIVPLPTAINALLGVVGFRGQLVPIYDLGQLMGHTAARETPRWIVLLKSSDPVAIAFDAFDAQLRVPRHLVKGLDALEPPLRSVPQVVAMLAGVVQGEPSRPIVHLPAVLESIRQQVGAHRPAGPHSSQPSVRRVPT